MDIDLLAKMVGELILDNDEVALPGVGTFVAELVGASFSDKGFVINPPYRKLSFRQREGDAGLLVDFYARTNKLEKSTAADILGKFLAEMKEALKTKKYVVFPGLGRLRATRENVFFFVPDEDLNIYPEGFGLEPVSLKSHEELEEVAELAETAAAVAAIQSAPSDPSGAETPGSAPLVAENVTPGEDPYGFAPPADKTAVAPVIPPPEIADQVGNDAPASATASATEAEAPAVTTASAASSAAAPEPAPASLAATPDSFGPPEAQTRHRRSRPFWLRPLLVAAATVAGALLLLAVLGRVAPQFVDRFLYTAEELEILYR